MGEYTFPCTKICTQGQIINLARYGNKNMNDDVMDPS